MRVSHAPARNLLTPITSRVTPVATAPRPLIAAFSLPAWPRARDPVAHHAGLGERKGQECAHRKQRDQRVAVAAEDDDQRRGGERKQQDAVGEHQPVAQAGQLARQEAVLAPGWRPAAGSRRSWCWPPPPGSAACCLDDQVGRTGAQQPPGQRRKDRLLRAADHRQAPGSARCCPGTARPSAAP